MESIFHYLCIPKRTLSEASRLAYISGRNKPNKLYNNYKCGYHISWDNQRIFFRSSYELDCAKELDQNKIHYEVESLRIPYLNTKDNKFHTAIPDFYISNKNMIVEIKSSYTLDKQQMIDKIKEYKKLGYNFKLICDYQEISL